MFPLQFLRCYFGILVFEYHPEYWPFLRYHIVNRTSTAAFKRMIKVSDLDICNQSVKMLLAIPPTMTSSAKILINSRTNFIKIIYIPLNMPISLPPCTCCLWLKYTSPAHGWRVLSYTLSGYMIKPLQWRIGKGRSGWSGAETFSLFRLCQLRRLWTLL